FTMLRLKEVKETIEKVNSQKLKNKIFILEYSQRDLPYILEKVDFKKLLFIRGSWYHALHYRPEYHILLKKQADYKLLSPFTNEAEARGYVENIKTIVLKTSASMSPIEMMRLVNQVASQSYDYAGYQIGAVLGKKTGGKYKYISSSHNIIVPFETYAMHYGAAREENFAQSQDLNHYDTVHAEMSLLLKVMSQKINLTNTSLFISVLPCPTCARMLGQTNITEFVYANDHSDGYALKMLEMSGKSVKRLVV
ncbi:MAG TPA: deaminase, partial [Candidatus Saccharimonadales bacterium]|nr:deaminase [Candidatus Saccharimonadales bacterium]